MILVKQNYDISGERHWISHIRGCHGNAM
uniref:Uncharacterized protein n=1 Tax=Anguilla anguilla TaxID=7936 RepID=A0A0E9U939_ANGAN